MSKLDIRLHESADRVPETSSQGVFPLRAIRDRTASRVEETMGASSVQDLDHMPISQVPGTPTLEYRETDGQMY